jgi:hypothetical protein
MAKLRPGEKQVRLSFQRPDDLRLFALLEKEAYRCRWNVPTFILASLQDAFKDRIEEEEVSAIAEEAARKVRERAIVPAVVEVPVPAPLPLPPPSSPVSMDVAMAQAEAQIAALNPPGMKLKKGKIPVPEMPKEK